MKLPTRTDRLKGTTRLPSFYASLRVALLCGGLLPGSILDAVAALAPEPDKPALKQEGPLRTDIANLNDYNRVHRRSNVWLNITNWGYFGNNGENRREAVDDPCLPGQWAPQLEYPGGSNVQYLFQGALWLGALIQEEGYEYPRVSVGMDGWMQVNEFWPGEGEHHSLVNGIVERSTLPIQYDCLGNFIGGFQDSAISEQDFVVSYADTLTESFRVDNDPIDGPHLPLGIKVIQKSYAWTYNYAQNFIIIDWEIENIAGNYLKNLYVGLYVDADVGRRGNVERHTDDITGFQKWFKYETLEGEPDSSVINTAWIADNDGRHQDVPSGSSFEAPAVMGVRVVRAPNPKLRTSYNWWISNGDPDLDFGPSLKEDKAPGGWTKTFGTPMGDVRKYFILSNGEFDYDQVYVDNPEYIRANPMVIKDRWNPEAPPIATYDWKVPGVDDDTPDGVIDDLANGYDTRFLLSWGPLGIFDHLNEQGERIYRLNPGEKFSMTVGIVMGDNFHVSDAAQPTNQTIDPELFNFESLRYNADWAARVYDNPMLDTPIYDWGTDGIPGTNDPDGTEGDGILDTGDGWYGEDVGLDGLYALSPGDVAYKWEGGIRREYIYPGPDPGENDGHLQREEDALERPDYLDYTRLNEELDFGDGHPDFLGPPPPPTPLLTAVKTPMTVQAGPGATFDITADMLSHNVVLHWNKRPSEDPNYKDPFSRENDFEGYRIYTSNTLEEKGFSFLDGFDKKNWSYFGAKDSLAWRPVEDSTLLEPFIVVDNERLVMGPVGSNLGFFGHEALLVDTLTDAENWSYYYIIRDTHPLIPKYYSVTAYDYGDYKTGTQPLESAKIANAIYVAPSGSDRKPVGVVPNPYRAYVDYRQTHGGISWENRDDGTAEFFPQTDRRLYFYNLPKRCLIRIYTVAGDMVDVVPHNLPGDDNIGWVDDYAEAWDLNSRNHQQVVSGMYLFTVEEYMDRNEMGEDDPHRYIGTDKFQTGKFVVIR